MSREKYDILLYEVCWNHRLISRDKQQRQVFFACGVLYFFLCCGIERAHMKGSADGGWSGTISVEENFCKEK